MYVSYVFAKKINMKDLLFKNLGLPLQKRVENFLSQMTIDEKVAQLMGLWFTDVDDFDNEYLNDPLKMKETFGNGCNSIHPTFHGIIYTIEQRNKIQKYLLEET